MLDKQATFSNKQTLAVAAGTHLGTNVYDLGVLGATPNNGAPIADLGRGGPVNLLIQVTETFVGGTSVQAQLVQADNENLVTGAEVLVESAAVPVASLKAGYQFRITTVPHGVTKRYLGVKYVTVGTFSAGKVEAGVLVDRQSNYTGI